MRVFAIGLSVMLILVLCGLLASGQGGAAAGQRQPNSQVVTGSSGPGPTDKILTWTPADLKAIQQELDKNKVAAAEHRFFREPNYNMEVRRLVGKQPILLHGKKGDLMIVQDGEGTFMSGGELVNPKAGGEDPGDMSGDSIRNGVSRVLKPGDVVWVPAGLPHAFVDTKDHVTILLCRFWTK